jgi:hypothetical protein
VKFLVDGRQVGPTRHRPPYSVVWNSRAATVGSHRITVQAVDRHGNARRTSIQVKVRPLPPPERIRVDASVVARGTGPLTAPRLSTSTPRTVLLALVSYDGLYSADQAATVSGGGLAWHLVKRSNSQPGGAEIWAATVHHRLDGLRVRARPADSGFAGMLSVLALRGASGVGVAAAAGSPTGAPEFYVPGVQEGSWVFAAGNDWDGAVARTPVAGQTLVRQWVNAGDNDTFWVQSTVRPSTSSRLVTIKDTAPTDHRWNYVGVEVVAGH